MKVVSRLVLTVLALLCIQSIVAQESAHAGPSQQQRVDAVNVMRLLNTSEAKCRAKSKKYASLEELVSSGALTETKSSADLGTEELNYAAPAHLLPGFSIQLTTSRDGDRYQVSLIDDTHEPHWALFSDEKGLIFEGQPIN
jgi:hypothetical protein